MGQVVDKVHEEIDEVMHEVRQAAEEKLVKEVGDLL
ncbi:MAG: MazG nucleotide pyrophosphohydrolase domain-containing protein [Symbiopectobacterium sp.]